MLRRRAEPQVEVEALGRLALRGQVAGAANLAIAPGVGGRELADGAVAHELWQLREGVTLADWMSARVEEHLEPRDTATAYDFAGAWCARAERRTPVAGHTLERSAFFFPPLPPTGLELPPDSQPEQLVAACTLGLVWTRAPELDSADGAESSVPAGCGVWASGSSSQKLLPMPT